MRNGLAALILLTLTCAAPAAAQSTVGMGALQYYVGTWSCMAGPIGGTPSRATATYTLDGDIMRQWVEVPAQGKMKKPYYLSIVTAYSSKLGRYVNAQIDSDAGWGIAYVRPWLPGGAEQGVDHVSSTGKLGHGVTVRASKSAWTYTSYPTLTATKPDFRVSCTRTT